MGFVKIAVQVRRAHARVTEGNELPLIGAGAADAGAWLSSAVGIMDLPNLGRNWSWSLASSTQETHTHTDEW